MGSVCKINLLRTMRIIVIYMVWRGIDRVPVVRPNIWSTFIYQTSIKGKEVEMNFIDSDGQVVLTHLDVSNFIENLNGKIDHLIGDGNVCYD